MFEYWKPEEGATIHFLDLPPPVFADVKEMPFTSCECKGERKVSLPLLNDKGLPSGKVMHMSETAYQKLVMQIEEKVKATPIL